MAIRFLYPYFLLLLPATALLWWLPRRLDNRVHGILRTAVVALLLVALARPVLLVHDREPYAVLVLDASASLSDERREQAQELVRRWTAEVKDPEKSAVVVLDADPEQSLSEVLPAGLAGGSRAVSGADHAVVRVGDPRSTSSLSAALAAALRQIPDGSPGAITVLSDGLSTDRRWGPTVQSLTRRGIVVNVADLGRDEADLYPADLVTDPVLRVGQTARVDVRLIGPVSGAQVRLLDAEGSELAASPTLAGDGEDDGMSVALEFEPERPGFLPVRAEVVAANRDSYPTNNMLETTLAIQPPIRMLYLGERVEGGAVRLDELLGGGFAIEDGSDWDLAALPDLAPYDLVMIDDRTATRVPEAFQTHLAEAVRERGLGLVFSGGKAAFGAGGYDETPLAHTLPVELQQKTEKRDPSTALAIIIDTSGSMGGTRIELAKQVARLAVRRLKAHDRVGIVEFYGNKHWALPLQSAANKITIDRAIGRMQAIGGTVLYPAIEEAYYGLKNMATRYKHILIITDAGVEDTDYESLVRRIAKDRINLSTALVGAAAHSQTLIDMASWGDGRFYSAADRYALPEMVLKQPSTMKLPAYRSGTFPVLTRGASGWWDEIDRAAVPPLSGYVETRSRSGAEVLVEVEGNGHPVLATWRYGLGRVTALMTEPVGEGTESWRDWRGYGRLLARVAQRTADDSRPFRYRLERRDRRVTLHARRLSPVETLRPRARLLDEQGRPGELLPFRQLAPGFFTADWGADPEAELRIGAEAVDGSGKVERRGAFRLVSPVAADVAPELQVDPRQALNLEALAAATSGTSLDPARPEAAHFDAVPESQELRGLELHKLWWYALLLGLLLYLAELVYRRWPRTA